MTTTAITKEPAAMSATALAITPIPADAPMPRHRTGSLSHTGEGDITERLGFPPARHTVEGKSDQEWLFRVGEHDCAIWDAKGAGKYGCWSTYGPPEIFAAIFGWRAVR